jgi:hypothetical protein
MGTSQSSAGPGANVALIPPWADPDTTDPPDVPTDAPPQDRETLPGTPPPIPASSPLASERRFAGARRSLGAFAKTGDTARLRRGVAHYIRHGYGGSSTMSRRLKSVPATARSLSRALDPGITDSSLDRTLLNGKSADEIIDAVVEAARPQDGTLDAEASREAVRDALSDLLGQFANVDLLDLSDAQREFVIERFTAHDVYRRFALDVGKHLVANAPNAKTGLARLKQARSYIRQTVAESFRRIRESGRSMTISTVRATVATALADSLAVFEGYLT